jgi:glutaredoxin
MGRVGIVVYTTSWCPACKQARSWMNENGVAYSERDIERDRDAHDTLKKISGGTTIPTFDIEGQVRVGFSPSWVQSAVRGVAERKLARTNF